MKKITIVCALISLFSASLAFGSDFLGTYCWVDNEGDVLELAVTSVGDGTNFTLNGIYYDDGLASPTTGNLAYVGGSTLSGVVTTADRSGSLMLQVVGHMELNLYSLNGTMWGVPKGTNVYSEQQAEAPKRLSLTQVNCY